MKCFLVLLTAAVLFLPAVAPAQTVTLKLATIVGNDNPFTTSAYKFKEIAEAYQVLCDPERRGLYDRRMRLTRQNGISDYDLGFTNFLYTFETSATARQTPPPI